MIYTPVLRTELRAFVPRFLTRFLQRLFLSPLKGHRRHFFTELGCLLFLTRRFVRLL